MTDMWECAKCGVGQTAHGIILTECIWEPVLVDVAEGARLKRDAAEEMYEALRAAEWGRSERVCPVCRRLDFEEHRKDCLLANALAKADGKPRETK